MTVEPSNKGATVILSPFTRWTTTWVRVRSSRFSLVIADPKTTGGHVLTREDVMQLAQMPGLRLHQDPVLSFALDGNGYHRERFDTYIRQFAGKGGRLGLTMKEAAMVRTGYWAGDTALLDYHKGLGIGLGTLKRIVAGHVYWWCGGGLPEWEGLSWFRRE